MEISQLFLCPGIQNGRQISNGLVKLPFTLNLPGGQRRGDARGGVILAVRRLKAVWNNFLILILSVCIIKFSFLTIYYYSGFWMRGRQ